MEYMQIMGMLTLYCDVKKSKFEGQIYIKVLPKGDKYHDDNLKEKDKDKTIGFKK